VSNSRCLISQCFKEGGMMKLGRTMAFHVIHSETQTHKVLKYYLQSRVAKSHAFQGSTLRSAGMVDKVYTRQ